MSWITRFANLLAQAGGAEGVEGGVGIRDNKLLDEWRIPFGDWAEQAVFWMDNNLQTLLDIANWPFERMISFLVRDILSNVSWVWVVLVMMIVATLVRNIKVGVFVGVSLFICGILGDVYWLETARTIGFVGVAVVLCVIVGIPIGIACGRFDGIWKVVRPVLDAMQVIHSFVYMLPFIFFWGIGEVSATMVTMVFALPPLIRLTNLGIRQVPADVVEASRAYGASERRVLFDVQIPLARPAIMTGINQTLLLSISMLGIAAIMGAGGLGRLLFQAINNQDVSQAAAAGLAFFLVAVVLDRMSQREETDSANLFRRIRLAWAHRRDPEVLLENQDASAVVKFKETHRYAPVTAAERLPMVLALAGGALALLSVFLPWTADAGKMSAYGRWVDLSTEGEMAGMVFSGLHTSGGSWFGISILFFSIFAILAVIVGWARPGRGPRWLAADGAVIASLGILILAAAHLLARPGSASITNALHPGTGLGVVLALAGGLAAVAGSIWWMWSADHTPLHPLRSEVAWGRLIGAGVAILVLVIGMFSGWSFDEREREIITPELQAQIDQLMWEAEQPGADLGAIATRLLVLRASAIRSERLVTDGLSSQGPGLGLWGLIVGALGFLASLPAVGLFGSHERRLWHWSTITAGLGMGTALIGFAWVFTHVRSADPNYLTGIGAFLTMSGGMFLVASNMSVLKEFRRAKVYDDPQVESGTDGQAAEHTAEERAEALV